MFVRPLTPERLEVAGTPTGITRYPGGGERACAAVATVEDAPVRYWANGTLPSASFGHLVNPGGIIELRDQNEVLNFKAVGVGGTAVLQVQPYSIYIVG